MQASYRQFLLADAHPCSRIGVHRVIKGTGFKVLAEANSVDECKKQLAHYGSTLLLIACNLLHEDPISIIGDLRQQHPKCRLVLFIADCDALPLQAITNLGVQGMVTKKEALEMLGKVMKRVTEGEIAYSPIIVRTLLQSPKPDSSFSIVLCQKERQLLHLVCAEKNNAEIAQSLNVSEKTIEHYLSELHGKLGVQTRTGAAVWFTENKERIIKTKVEGIPLQN